jgi:transcriptional regulator with XRE-family HTH domain
MTVTTGGQPTGASAGAVSDYAPPAPDSTRALSLRADYLRTEVDILGGEVQELHGEARELYLTDRTFEKTKKSVSVLLEELAGKRGMGWSDIAEVVGVSISAIRKWRKGGDASPTSRSKLGRIAALLDVLEEKGLVQDPAAWMEMDLPLDPGYFSAPWICTSRDMPWR